MSKHPGLWVVALIWLLPSLGGGFVLWALPDAVLGSRDAGSFVSASASAGGPFSQPVTTVQTSQGTWVIDGAVSAHRGQPLVVVDSTKDGLRLCASLPPRCVPLAGEFVGSMRTTSRGSLNLSNDAWEFWCGAAAIWFLLGAVVFAVSIAFIADETEIATA